jgi:hypothetical protein
LDLSVFALEVCMRLDPAGRLRDNLHSLITSHPESSEPWQKAQLMRRVAELVEESQDLIEKGIWDFFDDDARARRTFEDYSEPLRNERGARKEPSGSPERHGDPRYMTLTVAMLLVNGSPCERELSAMCDTPEEKLWRRETFLKMLRALLKIDYGVVKGDVLYLIPGDLAWGLTAADLADSKFAYLRQVV